MLNILMGDLPHVITINGRQYQIDSDFRIGIQYEEIVRNSIMTDEEKIWRALTLFYKEIPIDIQSAVDKMLWFYRCGKPAEDVEQKKKRYRQKTSDDPAYAFLQDAPYIFADFKSQYGIDLTEQTEVMHWWKFSALFESLGEKTKMGEIMYYRKIRTTGMPKERRAFINDMKRLYKIADESTGRQRLTLDERNRRWVDYVKTRREVL